MKNNESKNLKENLNSPMLMDMHHAAEALGICYRSIQNLVYERKIGFVRIGKNYKFRIEDLNNYIERNYIKPVK